eukprot:6212333-Pleurochrysis_carterae.AAC.4
MTGGCEGRPGGGGGKERTAVRRDSVGCSGHRKDLHTGMLLLTSTLHQVRGEYGVALTREKDGKGFTAGADQNAALDKPVVLHTMRQDM